MINKTNEFSGCQVLSVRKGLTQHKTVPLIFWTKRRSGRCHELAIYASWRRVAEKVWEVTMVTNGHVMRWEVTQKFPVLQFGEGFIWFDRFFF